MERVFRMTTFSRLERYARFIILIFVIAFMQGIYNYIPETNYISSACSVVAVLCVQFVLHVMLFRS